MRQKNSRQINAVLGEEFDELLKELGVINDFNAGNYKCNICGDTIGPKNVLLIYPKSEDDIGFICKKSTCLSNYNYFVK